MYNMSNPNPNPGDLLTARVADMPDSRLLTLGYFLQCICDFPSYYGKRLAQVPVRHIDLGGISYLATGFTVYHSNICHTLLKITSSSRL